MVKAMDLKFDIHVPRDSPEMTLKMFSKEWRGQGHVTSIFILFLDLFLLFSFYFCLF